MKNLCWRSLLSVLVATSVAEAGAATYQEQVNATRAAAVAKGNNAIVVMVEAPSRARDGAVSTLHFAPELNNSRFRNVDIRTDAAAKASAHSNTVAQLFFGSSRSIASGISTAYVFHSRRWLDRLSLWDLDPSHVSGIFPGPVINHSHVAGPRDSSELLRRADYSALSNNVLHVAGVRRSGAGDHLMAGGFNSLAVGGAFRNIETPYPAIDELYGEGRTRPHVVVPFAHASAGAPVVAAAAVRLNALADQKKLTFPTEARHGSEQLPVELIKALLMASASPGFNFTHKEEVVVNGFGTVGVTANGLDKRYGMGMLNVGAAESLLRTSAGPVQACSSGASGAEPGIAIGAQQSPAAMASDCNGPESGYSYHPGLSGAGGTTASYEISPSNDGTLTASLVWLADIRRDGNALVGDVYDFDLRLVDAEAGSAAIASSAASADTTENVRATVKRDRTYRLDVTRKGGNQKPWPFAIAWHLSD